MVICSPSERHAVRPFSFSPTSTDEHNISTLPIPSSQEDVFSLQPSAERRAERNRNCWCCARKAGCARATLAEHMTWISSRRLKINSNSKSKSNSSANQLLELGGHGPVRRHLLPCHGPRRSLMKDRSIQDDVDYHRHH